MTQEANPGKRAADPQLLALTNLIRLEQRIRACTLPELRFVAVNETIALCSYQQAILWEAPSGNLAHGRVTSASGVSQPAADSPYIDYVTRLLRALAATLDKPRVITPDAVTGHTDLAEDWHQWLPPALFWQPLAPSGGVWRGGLLLMREQPWNEAEGALLNLAADAYAHHFAELTRKAALPPWVLAWRKLRTRKTLYAVIIICLLPLKNSVLAPAEVIAESPILIRAPIDGIIAKIDVQPNQQVKAGDLLLSFDKAELTTKLAVAQKAEQVADLELRQTVQASMSNDAARNEVAAAKGRLEETKADVGYYTDLLSRADVTAPQDGVVVFEDVYDWLGRPASIGQRIMMLADPTHTQLEVNLPADKWTPLPDKAEVSFFSNNAPYAPDHATLYYASYRSTQMPDGTTAYRLRAHWDGNADDLRLGQRGTAVVYTYRSPLIWHLVRRPLGIVRQWMGW